MPMPQSTYSDAQRDAVEGWLKDGLSALRIAGEFARQFHVSKSRNAIIGMINRTPALKRLYSGRAPARPNARREPSASVARREPKPKLHLHPGNIRGKLEARSFDPPYAPPAKPVDGRAYDRESRRLPLEELGWKDCRFAVNDAHVGETHLFCGMPQRPDAKYCPHHCDRAYAGYSARVA